MVKRDGKKGGEDEEKVQNGKGADAQNGKGKNGKAKKANTGTKEAHTQKSEVFAPSK